MNHYCGDDSMLQVTGVDFLRVVYVVLGTCIGPISGLSRRCGVIVSVCSHLKLYISSSTVF